MIPAVLQGVATAMTEAELTLPSGGGDARRDSSDAESTVILWMQNQRRWDIYSPNVAASNNLGWYDLQVDGLYCDIKVSNLRSNDNTNAKQTIYYFLTGDTENPPQQRNRFFAQMKEREDPDEQRDFYFIVVDKTTSETFIVSLKGIHEVTPSVSNPPFQCRWTNCRTPVERTWEEAKHFLLSNWATSIRREAELHQLGMPAHYSEFFE